MRALLLAFLIGLAAAQAGAQGLAAYASPSRFEVTGVPGETRRHVVEIHHAGRDTGRFRIYTNDWDYLSDRSLKFSDVLEPGSCRPWVAIERRELSVPPNGRYRFRFEVTPPAGTPPGECRFAIMIEGADPARVVQEGLTFPISGRLGVIVYVAIGEAAPRLAVGEARVAVREGERLPVLDVTNSGNAHGRLEGFLTAKDAAGREFEIAPEDLPILPGRKREIALREVVTDAKAPPAIRYPLVVKGTLEWGKSREAVELRFVP